MKPTLLVRTALRTWIALTSLLTFLVGWVMLAHSPKPIQNGGASGGSRSTVIQALPTLAPLPPLDLSGESGGGAAPAPQLNPSQSPGLFSQSPVFSTGGS